MLEKLLSKITNKSIGDKIQYGLRMIFKQMLVSCVFTEIVLLILAVKLGSLDPEVAASLGNPQILVFLGLFFPLFFLFALILELIHCFSSTINHRKYIFFLFLQFLMLFCIVLN